MKIQYRNTKNVSIVLIVAGMPYTSFMYITV